MTDSDILTPTQQIFLRRFFATPVGQHFCLTGGTALAAFHLYHRRSVDLDLFTLDERALIEATHTAETLARELGWSIARARSSEAFRQFTLAVTEVTTLQVDMVRDVGPQFGERRSVEGVVVDSMENIGANKITAILGRTDVKDFVDLYFILQAGYDFDELFDMARQKDLGLMEFFFVGSLLQVRYITRLPEMLKPLDLAALRQFFMAMADEMLDKLEPDQRALLRR